MWHRQKFQAPFRRKPSLPKHAHTQLYAGELAMSVVCVRVISAVFDGIYAYSCEIFLIICTFINTCALSGICAQICIYCVYVCVNVYVYTRVFIFVFLMYAYMQICRYAYMHYLKMHTLHATRHK